MIIHNFLPQFIESVRQWEIPPTLADLKEGYYKHIRPWVEGVLWIQSAASFRSAIEELDWKSYRKESLLLDPEKEEARVRDRLRDVETLFGFRLEGEIVLFGSFAMMDGFARFDRGRHRVFLGVDESHARGRYLDVLIAHELTHVARESRPNVWEGWGLDPRMSREDFGEYQPVIEHVFGEGFSCAVSELLVPGEPAWTYAYQTEESLAKALAHSGAIDRRIKDEIRKPHARSDYTRLYNPAEYGAPVPPFSQYVWGWQWAKRLLRERESARGGARELVNICSKDLLGNALSFELKAPLG